MLPTPTPLQARLARYLESLKRNLWIMTRSVRTPGACSTPEGSRVCPPTCCPQKGV